MTATSPAPKKRLPAKVAKVAKAAKPATATTSAKAAKPAVEAKQKREKLVRDSFTIPKGEYAAFGELKHRAVALARPVKKSELLRAGLKALAAMSDSAFLGLLRKVPEIKTGRPAAVGATPALAPKARKGRDAEASTASS